MKTTTKERPIMFKSEMVRAILAGAKTQTRRPCKNQPSVETATDASWRDAKADLWRNARQYARDCCPYGVPGDRLWVKETWRVVDGEILYPANDGRGPWPSDHLDSLWDVLDRHGENTRPSIHMPRWASRITLEIVSVRVERVSDIAEADILREGVTVSLASQITGVPWIEIPTLHDAWRLLWDSIYAKTPNAWAANPWVWVVEFKRVES